MSFVSSSIRSSSTSLYRIFHSKGPITDPCGTSTVISRLFSYCGCNTLFTSRLLNLQSLANHKRARNEPLATIIRLPGWLTLEGTLSDSFFFSRLYILNTKSEINSGRSGWFNFIVVTKRFYVRFKLN